MSEIVTIHDCRRIACTWRAGLTQFGRCIMIIAGDQDIVSGTELRRDLGQALGWGPQHLTCRLLSVVAVRDGDAGAPWVRRPDFERRVQALKEGVNISE